MLKQLRMACAAATLALAAMSSAAAAQPQSPFPSAGEEFPPIFWTETRMKAMDANKDGMVSRDEFLAYMGRQFDVMDTGRKRMLTRDQFMDRKMMQSTFPTSVSETGPR